MNRIACIRPITILLALIAVALISIMLLTRPIVSSGDTLKTPALAARTGNPAAAAEGRLAAVTAVTTASHIQVTKGESTAASDSSKPLVVEEAARDQAEAQAVEQAQDQTRVQKEAADYEQLLKGQRVEVAHAYRKPEKKTVYLTFDDGPSGNTPEVLDILRKAGIQATFFVLGNEAETHPDMIRRIVKEGHAIGNHSYDHVYQDLYIDFSHFWRQVTKTDAILDRIADVHTHLLRAPGGTFGHFDAFYFYYLERAGYSVHDWDIDSGDSRRRGVPAKEIIAEVENSPLSHEVTVLMHDGAGHAETVKALPEIIRYFQDKGYTFAKLTDDVKPATFRISPNVPKRQINAADYAETLALLEADGGQKADAAQLEKAIAAQQADVPAAPLQPIRKDRDRLLPLHINAGKDQIVFQPDEYEMVHGKLYVPLRALFNGLGGSVDWNETLQEAHADYRGTQLTYDTSERRLQVTHADGDELHDSLDIHWKDGTILVPLRQTLQFIGMAVDSYAEADNLTTVHAA